ncbi:MAG: DUF2293 domain-containing protein [Ahrensia sp.]|nr:DUF2293 domain-containing protein [Ahrensia sp.]
MTTKFQQEIRKALNQLVPMVPLEDAEAIKDIARRRHLRHLPASIGAWLAVTTHIRHNHTDYDDLLDEGYDSDSARFFVLEAMNDVLRDWQSTKLLDPDEDEISVLKAYPRAAELDKDPDNGDGDSDGDGYEEDDVEPE